MATDTSSIQPVSTQALDIYTQDTIQSRIYTIRGVQVMLDRDLAMLYQIPTGRLNEAVKRNIERFPDDFMFQLTKDEWESLKSQIVISNSDNEGLKSQIATSKNGRGGVRKLPYAFTEEGVSQLASVLHSSVAIQTSIRIHRAFVAMRKFLTANAGVFQRLDQLERHQLLTDTRVDDANARIENVLNRLDDGSLRHKLGMFFDGQMFESFSLVEELVKRAHTRIVLIDDYVDANVLEHFRLRDLTATVDVYVHQRHQTPAMLQAFQLYHQQYPSEHVQLHTFNKAHDRWLIIDDEVYHFGASIKDLGLKWFSVNLVTEYTADDLIARL